MRCAFEESGCGWGSGIGRLRGWSQSENSSRRPGPVRLRTGLIAVRIRPPVIRAASSKALEMAEWPYLPARFDAWPSAIPWRGDRSYPLSTGCYGRSPKLFPPTSSTGESRTGFNGPTESAVPPNMQRLPAGKKAVGLTGWVRKPAIRFQSSRRKRGRRGVGLASG